MHDVPEDDIIEPLEDELCDVLGEVEDGNSTDVIHEVEDDDNEDGENHENDNVEDDGVDGHLDGVKCVQDEVVVEVVKDEVGGVEPAENGFDDLSV